jgi:ABC-2 type transport system ATP-binding protein
MSIQVSAISKNYGEQKALDQVSFEVSQGEVVGFLGPNGAGKSTMMKILTGYLPQTAGNARICDLEVTENSLALRRLIGYLPEHNPLYLDMYVREYLEFVASVYGLKGSKKRIEEMIDMTGLMPESHKKIGALSKGYRQRVGLAQALLPDPKVLILDEPTTGLDPNQIAEVRELIRSLGREKTILLSTHIMQEVQAICQRVIIINKGVLVADNHVGMLEASTFKNEVVVKVEFDRAVNISQLQAIPNVEKVTAVSEKSYQIVANDNGGDVRVDLFKFAVANNLVLLSMSREMHSLEDVFHALTQTSGR